MEAGHSREADILHEGYVTYLARDVPTKARIPTSGGVPNQEEPMIEPLEDGMAAEWVCKSCFDQFRQTLGFILAEQ